MVVKDCLDILKDGNTISGVYEVYLDKAQKFVKIFCDLDTDNGGWLVRNYVRWHVILRVYQFTQLYE